MLKIGETVITPDIVLGPMAGVTDLPFRIECTKQGAGLTYCELVSSKALFYDDKKTKLLLKTDERENMAVQIFGSEPEIMAYAAKKIQDMNITKIIDINMGCPAPKIVNNGDGCALMKNIKLAEEIIKTESKTAKKSKTTQYLIKTAKNGDLQAETDKNGRKQKMNLFGSRIFVNTNVLTKTAFYG